MAQDAGQMRNLWKIRESSAIAGKSMGYNIKFDVSLPLDSMYRLVEDCRNRTKDYALTIGYGHIGDSNLHINMLVPDQANVDTVMASIDPWIYEFLRGVGGSISAEHGIGLMKAEKLQYSKDATQIEYMRRIKNLFDPNGILNPYKVFPSN